MNSETILAYFKAHKKTVIEITFGFVLGVALTTCAMAADLNISWTLATQNTDGSAIPATGNGSLTGTRIEWGVCDGVAWGGKTGERVVPAPGTSTVVTGVEPGTWCVRGYSVNTYGTESVASALVSVTKDPPTPKPPVMIALAGATAFELKTLGNGQIRLGRAVGTVTQDTACILQFPDENHWIIDKAHVQFDKTPKSFMVVAECVAT
jgi:hypothetical protein